jgi:hypothetical protein
MGCSSPTSSETPKSPLDVTTGRSPRERRRSSSPRRSGRAAGTPGRATLSSPLHETRMKRSIQALGVTGEPAFEVVPRDRPGRPRSHARCTTPGGRLDRSRSCGARRSCRPGCG